ncbi:hypothetical protein [Pseudooceanicola sp. LIPI14-2-Ac024]|uniref:hypothetical protein n=1 Tax=Pseudooceanicola sp. LIPI14-2-Ac024 TaxID=3344875 RepID=UPI0035CF42AB
MIYLVGLVVAIVLVAIFSKPEMRGCRWRADRSRDRDGQAFWRCAACGSETFTDNGKPPDLCLRR